MIPKDCKRLAEVVFPIAEVPRRITPERSPVHPERQGSPVLHTRLLRSDAGFALRNSSRDGGS
jgi:hypothetical protein